MSSPNFMMISVAACAPSYVGDALNHLGKLCGELKEKAGAVTTRYGVVATGEHTGQVILFQTYDDMNGIGAAFDVYQSSATYEALTSSSDISVTLRNILKIEALGLKKPSTEVPAYGVATRWACPGLKLGELGAMVKHFETHGATVLRYCTTLTGPAAGSRLLLAGYPSMAAIQNTYEALRSDPGYDALLQDIDLHWRNNIRISG
jgi:hypothetical protein